MDWIRANFLIHCLTHLHRKCTTQIFTLLCTCFPPKPNHRAVFSMFFEQWKIRPLLPDRSAMTDKKKPSSVLSLRLSQEERLCLEQEAGRMSLSAYARSRLFGEQTTPSRKSPRRVLTDEKLLAQSLGKLGQSGLVESLNVLADAVRLGALPVTPETESALHTACADIAAMKAMLMRALRIQED